MKRIICLITTSAVFSLLVGCVATPGYYRVSTYPVYYSYDVGYYPGYRYYPAGYYYYYPHRTYYYWTGGHSYWRSGGHHHR